MENIMDIAKHKWTLQHQFTAVMGHGMESQSSPSAHWPLQLNSFSPNQMQIRDHGSESTGGVVTYHLAEWYTCHKVFLQSKCYSFELLLSVECVIFSMSTLCPIPISISILGNRISTLILLKTLNNALFVYDQT